MRSINYILRFIGGVIFFPIATIMVYFFNFMFMIFLNWDEYFENIKTTHTDMIDSFLKFLYSR